MRKIGFRQRSSVSQGEELPDCDEHPELHFNAQSSSTARPQRTFMAGSIAQNPFYQSLQPLTGRFGRHASFADSSFGGRDSQREISPSSQPDILGLQLLRDHPDPDGDIIFVHGLGGTALRTWSWKRDVSNFWPVWLNDEQGLSNSRIFSFGYNSNYKGAAINLNTIDFAKDLLHSMLTFSSDVADKTESWIPVRTSPIYPLQLHTFSVKPLYDGTAFGLHVIRARVHGNLCST